MVFDVKSKKWLWVGVLAAVVVVSFAAVACGGSASGPEQTVQTMLDAMEAKDVDAFFAIMDPEGLAQVEAGGLTLEAFKTMISREMTYDSMEFTDVKFTTEIAEDGQSAVVTVVEGKLTTVVSGESTTEDVKDSEEPQIYQLIQRDGKWYLDITSMM